MVMFAGSAVVGAPARSLDLARLVHTKTMSSYPIRSSTCANSVVGKVLARSVAHVRKALTRDMN